MIPPSIGVPVFLAGFCLLVLFQRRQGRRFGQGFVGAEPRRALNRFNLSISMSRVLIPLWFAAGVYLLGWDNSTLGPISGWSVLTPAILLGIMPGLLAWIGLWWAQFPVDRTVREQNTLSQLEADLPVFSPIGFGDYFMLKLRVQLLSVLVPWLVIQGLHDAVFLVLKTISDNPNARNFLSAAWMENWGDSILSLCCLLIVVLISPELLRRVLGTQRLGDLPLRQSLERICLSSGIGCRDILLWRTHHSLGNAAVMGIFPRVRFVILSDLLLESMTDEQIQAVFAHELGHIKHRHLIWFMLFLVSFSSAILALFSLFESKLTFTINQRQIFEGLAAIACGAIIWLTYGFLSRWFERQADVYAARAVQSIYDANAGAVPQNSGSILFASALERVAQVNNIPVHARNWSHGSIAARMRYIRQFGRDPSVAQQFDRKSKNVIAALSLMILICTAIVIYGQLKP